MAITPVLCEISAAPTNELSRHCYSLTASPFPQSDVRMAIANWDSSSHIRRTLPDWLTIQAVAPTFSTLRIVILTSCLSSITTTRPPPLKIRARVLPHSTVRPCSIGGSASLRSEEHTSELQSL